MNKSPCLTLCKVVIKAVVEEDQRKVRSSLVNSCHQYPNTQQILAVRLVIHHLRNLEKPYYSGKLTSSYAAQYSTTIHTQLMAGYMYSMYMYCTCMYECRYVRHMQTIQSVNCILRP